MIYVDDPDWNDAINSWREAALHFNVEVVSPYMIAGNECAALALVKGRGGQTVVVDALLPPKFEASRQVLKFSHENGFYYSGVNIVKCKVFNEGYFRDMLEDWGLLQK